MKNILLNTFSKNRAEEYPSDLWQNFVIPPRYEEYSCLFNYSKAVMIEGGRGSGKTMFIKYHCHQTRLSKKRSKISSEELKHIGLYFRPDTDFCSMINSFNFDTDWKKTFTHYLLLNLLNEFASAITSISNTFFEDISYDIDLLELKTPRSLQNAIPNFPTTYGGLLDFQKELSTSFNLWVSDVDSFDKPMFLEPKTVLLSLIDGITSASTELENLCFYIYFDEFENLSSEQQTVINSWMKHGTSPLIFNAAYKRGAKVNRKTSSKESLVQRNDYRVVDVESFEASEFRFFAAEVLCLKLMEYIKFEGYEKLRNYFCNEQHIDDRKTEEYKNHIIKIARDFLPGKPHSEIAKDVISEGSLKRRIENFLIPQNVTKSYTRASYIDPDYPEESIVNGIILNRKKYTPDSVLTMFTEAKEGNKEAYKNLIDQNLVGGILWVYLSASWKKNPLYTGFDRFCTLSRGNMRHFLELCHQTLSVAARNGIQISIEHITPIDTDIQAEAAVTSSRLDLIKIDELGQHGEKLRFIANRLGLFFQVLQKRKSQSETEVNHFSIKLSDRDTLDETTKTLLDEAVIWSVLIEVEGDTKRKTVSDASSKEYMLHPIYSPHFGISYRRKKKFVFSKEEISSIFAGSEEDYFKLRNKYAKKWEVDIDDDSLSKNTDGSSSEGSQRGFWDC